MSMIIADAWDYLFGMPQILFVIGGIVGVVGIVAGTVGGVASRRAREETKREIAAYVAEGTIDPDKAVEMMKADRPEE